jgi:hypothetical protein
LIERLNNVRRLPEAPGEWESGYWVIADATAQRLIGADLFLHSGQTDPSHFGGKIVGYRTQRDTSDVDGRIIFRIVPTLEHKGVVTGREGWGNEKKYVW